MQIGVRRRWGGGGHLLGNGTCSVRQGSHKRRMAMQYQAMATCNTHTAWQSCAHAASDERRLVCINGRQKSWRFVCLPSSNFQLL